MINEEVLGRPKYRSRQVDLRPEDSATIASKAEFAVLSQLLSFCWTNCQDY